MIDIKKLSYSYTGLSPWVLNNINLKINSGDYISVVGENGSGKSTLIRLILGLIKPTGGSISIDAHITGYVPQKNDFSNSGFPITVFEMLDSYRRILKVKSKSAVLTNLERVGMESYRDALIGTLSGGQRQKVFIARALTGNPDLLVLDEPSTGIDVLSQKEIYRFLKKLNQENGVTIVSVEHNMQAALSNSSLIFHLSAGQGHLCTPERFAAEYMNNLERDENIV